MSQCCTAEFVWCHYYRCTGPVIQETHCHDYHELVIVTDGIYHFEAAGESHSAEAGDLVLHPATITHREWNDEDAQPEFHVLSFFWNSLPKGIPPLQRDRYGRICQLVQWLNERWWWGGECEPSYPAALLHSILGELQHLSFYQVDPFVESVRGYIMEHLSSSLTVEDLATHFHMSRSTFTRTFKAATRAGVSPMQEVRRLRMAHLRHLLETTDATLAAVANAVGLSDEVSLSHFTKKYIGLSPGDIRKGKGKTKDENLRHLQGLDRCD